MFAFTTPSVVLGSRVHVVTNRSRCLRTRTRITRIDMGLGTIFVDALVLGVVAAGTTYVLRDKILASAKESVTKNTSEATNTSVNTGVLGLMGESRSTPKSGKFQGAAPRLKDRAVPLQEPIPNAESRRAEEMAWATNALGDLGQVTIAVFDGSGALVSASGDLLRLQNETIKLSANAVASSSDVSVRDNPAAFPFLDPGARSVATLPLKVFGGMLIVASDEKNFFGPHELRVTQAVATRLASFMPLVFEESTGR